MNHALNPSELVDNILDDLPNSFSHFKESSGFIKMLLVQTTLPM